MRVSIFISLLATASLAGCLSKTDISQDFAFSPATSAKNNDALLLFVRPPQIDTYYRIKGINPETGTVSDTEYAIGGTDAAWGPTLVVPVNPEALSDDNKKLYHSSKNFPSEYGIETIEAGDYAVVEHAGANYIARCMADSAISFHVEAGKINVVDTMASLFLRGALVDTDAEVDTEFFENYVADVIKAYPGISGEIKLVQPIGIVDFDKPTALGIMKVACASANTFETFDFLEGGDAEQWE